jgi:peptide/nickel transport system substrate-binding protein
MRLAYLVLVIGLLWLGVNFVQTHRVQAPTVGGRYVEAVVGSPQYINPIFASTNDVDTDITRLVFSGLMRYDEKNNLVPDLAEKFEVSADKKVYIFTLRQNVFWHDSEPFTAKDVVFTFETIQNVLAGSSLQAGFNGVTVSASGDYTVRFELSEPYAPFLGSLTVGILPEHVWYNVLPEEMRLAQMNIQPIGTGSFMFRKFTKDDTGHIYTYELTRFDKFYRQSAFIKDFVFQFFAEYDNDTGAVQALRSQQVNGLSFVPKSLRDKVDRKHITLHTLQLPQYTALFFNQDNNTVLKDKNVRLALAEAVDKDRIVREVLKGDGKTINSPVLPSFIGYDENLGQVDLSVETANKLLDKNWKKISLNDYRKMRHDELLKEMNLTNQVVTSTATSTATSTLAEDQEKQITEILQKEFEGGQSFFRQDKDGKLLVINLVTVETPEYQKTAQLIAGFWQEIGVKANLKFVSIHDLLRDTLKDRNYDILLYGEIVGTDADLYPFWHSSQIDYPGLNLSRYVNRNLDTILNQIRAGADEKTLADLYKKFQNILIGDFPAIFLYSPTYTYATLDNVFGIQAERISSPADRFNGVNSWYMKTKGVWKW